MIGAGCSLMTVRVQAGLSRLKTPVASSQAKASAKRHAGLETPGEQPLAIVGIKIDEGAARLDRRPVKAAASLEVRMNDLDQFLCRLYARVVTFGRAIDEVLQNMVLDHLGDEAVERAATCCSLLQYGRTARVFLESSFDGIELPPDTPHTHQELSLFLLPQGIRHSA